MESARRPPSASAKGQPRRARESDRLQRRPPVPRAAARQDAHRQLLEFRLCRAIWSSRGEARLSRVEGVAVADGFRPSAGASGSTLTPVPLPAHRTQRAVFPHWALGRDHAFAHGKLPRPHSQAFPSVAPPQPTIREAHDLPRLHRCFRLSHRCDRLHGLRRCPCPPLLAAGPSSLSLAHATPAGVSELFPELVGSRQSPGSLSPFRLRQHSEH